MRPVVGDEAGDGLGAQRLGHGRLDGGAALLAPGGHDERRHAAAEPERLEPALELGTLELAAHDGGEHVAGQPALGRVGDATAQQLERDDRHRLVEDQAVDLGQAAGVLDRHEPRLRQPAVGRLGAAHRQHERPRAQLRVAGHEAPAVPAAGPVVELGRQRGDRVGVQLASEGPQLLELAAAVEDQRSAADERRQRADDRVQAALGEDDALQSLLRGDRPLQEGVLLVDQAGEGALGQGDERHLVGHLEEREAALARGLDERGGDLLVPEARAEADARQPVVGQSRDVLALPRRRGERHPGREQELAAGEEGRRVVELGDVDPAHGDVELALPRQGPDVEVVEELADRQHGASWSSKPEQPSLRTRSAPVTC